MRRLGLVVALLLGGGACDRNRSAQNTKEPSSTQHPATPGKTHSAQGKPGPAGVRIQDYLPQVGAYAFVAPEGRVRSYVFRRGKELCLSLERTCLRVEDGLVVGRSLPNFDERLPGGETTVWFPSRLSPGQKHKDKGFETTVVSVDTPVETPHQRFEHSMKLEIKYRGVQDGESYLDHSLEWWVPGLGLVKRDERADGHQWKTQLTHVSLHARYPEQISALYDYQDASRRIDPKDVVSAVTKKSLRAYERAVELARTGTLEQLRAAPRLQEVRALYLRNLADFRSQPQASFDALMGRVFVGLFEPPRLLEAEVMRADKDGADVRMAQNSGWRNFPQLIVFEEGRFRVDLNVLDSAIFEILGVEKEIGTRQALESAFIDKLSPRWDLLKPIRAQK